MVLGLGAEARPPALNPGSVLAGSLRPCNITTAATGIGGPGAKSASSPFVDFSMSMAARPSRRAAAARRRLDPNGKTSSVWPSGSVWLR